MSKLADIANRDYDEEINIIKDTGNLWHGGSFAFAFAFLYFIDHTIFRQLGEPLFSWKVFSLIALPLAWRAWERHEVARELQREREIRMEAKLDALLGLINIQD